MLIYSGDNMIAWTDCKKSPPPKETFILGCFENLIIYSEWEKDDKNPFNESAYFPIFSSKKKLQCAVIHVCFHDRHGYSFIYNKESDAYDTLMPNGHMTKWANFNFPNNENRE